MPNNDLLQYLTAVDLKRMAGFEFTALISLHPRNDSPAMTERESVMAI
jgi:hypothetical protein